MSFPISQLNSFCTVFISLGECVFLMKKKNENTRETSKNTRKINKICAFFCCSSSIFREWKHERTFRKHKFFCQMVLKFLSLAYVNFEPGFLSVIFIFNVSSHLTIREKRLKIIFFNDNDDIRVSCISF